jgi:catechol 2,3-dioxygenase-like lactoylglutathione lyase family enzyme
MSTPTIRRVVIDHVTLRVRDLETSLRFYKAPLVSLGFIRRPVTAAPRRDLPQYG